MSPLADACDYPLNRWSDLVLFKAQNKAVFLKIIQMPANIERTENPLLKRNCMPFCCLLVFCIMCLYLCSLFNNQNNVNLPNRIVLTNNSALAFV